MNDYTFVGIDTERFATKKCSCCGETYTASTDNFYRSKNYEDGWHIECRKCSLKKHLTKERKTNIEDIMERVSDLQRDAEFKRQGLKVCRCCGEVKEFEEFAKNAKSLDGLSSYCKECHRGLASDYRKATRVKHK